MKISYKRLLDFVSLPQVGIEDLCDTLTMVGLAVEGFEKAGDDCILEVDVTTNRPDCLSHLGVARELAARYRSKLKVPDFAEPAAKAASGHPLPVSVTIEDPQLCPRYAARVITGLKVRESPPWLKRRLESVGQRPINNIVDITNLLLFELGHPLHAFDYDKLEGRRIIVRRAVVGELLTTLDGFKRTLDPSMLMICDGRGPVAVAGVMGGEESEISAGTVTLLLESAYFNPVSVRSTARRLGLRTEASYRFERGADPEMPVRALNLASRLIEELAEGECAGPVIDEYPVQKDPLKLELRTARIRQVLGIETPEEQLEEILKGLEFQILKKGNGRLLIQVPSFRGDITLEDDLVEELARHYGYDRIPSTYPAPRQPGRFLPTDKASDAIDRVLTGFGFYEAYNYSFTTLEKESEFLGRESNAIAIANPLSEAYTHLRTSLLPGLVASLRHNLNHGLEDVRLYEVGKVYLAPESGELKEVREEMRLALAATGSFYNPYWETFEHAFEFRHLKGIVEALLEVLGSRVDFSRFDSCAFLHPCRAARLTLEGRELGVVGEIHPKLREKLKLTPRVFLLDLSLEPLLNRPPAVSCYRPVGRFPAVERDLSFLVDKSIEFAKLELAIQALEIAELREGRLIDFYQGPNLPECKVSLTVRLTFAHSERTLTQEEVNQYSDQVFSELRSRFSAELR